MKGLIIKEPWIDYILDGFKIWEIRGSNTKIRGKIYLIKSGTGMIIGECELVDSFPLTVQCFMDNKDKHKIYRKTEGFNCYKNPHAWVLQNHVRYPEPIPYKHPKGAVIWVNLTI